MKKPLLERVSLPATAEEQLNCFVRTQLPRFTAPSDPVKWTRRAARLRREALRKIYLKGWPRELIGRRPPIVWGDVLRPAPSYVIRKLRYEIHPDYWIPALLYEPRRLRGRVPVVLNPNGHDEGGKAATYKQARCIHLARAGILALSFEFIGMSELGGDRDHDRFGFLDATGLAGVGFFYLAMSKALDILLDHPHADRRRVAMTGLSGGGWQTIVLSALDPRITLCVPVAGYTSVRMRTYRLADVGDLEQLPPDLTTVLDYQEMTAMLAPRPALQILNEKDDCCFRPDHTKLAIYDAIRPTYRAYGAADNFEYYGNTDPGTHNYDDDNRSQLYRFLGKHFDLDVPLSDVHDEREIYTEPELEVGLPVEQTSIITIARTRARQVTSRLRTPRTKAPREALRRRLVGVIRPPSYQVRATRLGHVGKATLFRFKTGPWTLPAASVVKSAAKRVELVLCDDANVGTAQVTSVRDGRVVLIDILGVGRGRCLARRQTLIQTCGHRVLGIQAAQILAAARWAARLGRTRKVDLVGRGLRSAFAALVAAALEPEHFESLTVRELPATLGHLFDRPFNYEYLQPVLCPGLLEVADVPQLISLLEGVRFVSDDRAVRTIP